MPMVTVVTVAMRETRIWEGGSAGDACEEAEEDDGGDGDGSDEEEQELMIVW